MPVINTRGSSPSPLVTFTSVGKILRKLLGKFIGKIRKTWAPSAVPETAGTRVAGTRVAGTHVAGTRGQGHQQQAGRVKHLARDLP